MMDVGSGRDGLYVIQTRKENVFSTLQVLEESILLSMHEKQPAAGMKTSQLERFW